MVLWTALVTRLVFRKARQVGYWAKAEMDRDQIALIAPTLADRIPEDHSVRLFRELLGTYD